VSLLESRRRVLTTALAGLTGAALLMAAAPAHAGVPNAQWRTGKATYYDNAGYGACGTLIDAARQDLVAVSARWWTSPNPNNDPLCRGVSVEVTYKGKTITVPVRDKCPSCDAGHIDLSRTAFQRFAGTDVGVLSGVRWRFVNR
jgi:expansin (peptidoglycan-binding protein)